jgi:hypothetical protein
VDHALVGAVVEVDEVLLPVGGNSLDVNGVSVVLRRNVATSGGKVQSRDVVGTVSVLELNRFGTGGQRKKLVTKADSHNGASVGVHQLLEVEDSLLTVGWVSGTVRDEDSIKVVGDLVDGVVPGEDGDGGTAGNQGTKDVLLDSTIDDGDVKVSGGSNVERLLGGDFGYQVDLLGIDERLVLVGIVLVSDGDTGEGGSLLTEVGDDRTGVDTRDGGDSLTLAPVSERLDSGPVRVLFRVVGDDDSSSLDVGGLKVLVKSRLVTDIGRNSVISNQGLGKDENLTAVGGIGHGLGVSNEGGGENGLSGDGLVGTEGDSLVDGTVLELSADSR